MCMSIDLHVGLHVCILCVLPACLVTMEARIGHCVPLDLEL